MYTEIQSYRIFIDSGTQKNRSFTTINLFNHDDVVIGTIQFFEEDMEEFGLQDLDHIYIQYPVSKFSFIVDILRNEKPLFLGYWENKYGKYGRICTGKEPVGEGEIPIPTFKTDAVKA